MSLQKNFDVFIIGELEIRRFDFFFFPLKNILELSLGLQLELVAFLGQLPCCRPPCSLPFSSQFFSFFFFGVCVISCFGRIYPPEFLQFTLQFILTRGIKI